MSRKLDAAIAEALGRKVEFKNLGEHGVDLFYTDKTSPFAVVPHYSTDGNAMLELDKEMRAKGVRLAVWQEEDGFSAIYYNPDYKGVDEVIVFAVHSVVEWGAWGNTMPKAVALEAYEALTGKEWSE